MPRNRSIRLGTAATVIGASLLSGATSSSPSPPTSSNSSAISPPANSENSRASGQRVRAKGFDPEELQEALLLCAGGRVPSKRIIAALPYKSQDDGDVDAAFCAARADDAAKVSGVPPRLQQVPLDAHNAKTLTMWSTVKTNASPKKTFAYLDIPEGFAAPGSAPHPNKQTNRRAGVLISQGVSLPDGCIDELPGIRLGKSVKTRKEFDALQRFEPATSESPGLLIKKQSVRLVDACDDSDLTL